MMSSFARRLIWLPVLLCSVSALAQPAARPTPRAALEFPLELKQKVVAGQTAVGTPVEGRLVIPTLVHGVVIPEGAVFTGIVEESAGRDGAKPSRLRVHVTASKWRSGTCVVDVYLTNVSYPRRTKNHDDSDDPANTLVHRRELIIAAQRNGGIVPMQEPEAPNLANRYAKRTSLEDVKLERGEKGVIAITSEKTNVHLDGGVVYSFEGTANK